MAWWLWTKRQMLGPPEVAKAKGKSRSARMSGTNNVNTQKISNHGINRRFLVTKTRPSKRELRTQERRKQRKKLQFLTRKKGCTVSAQRWFWRGAEAISSRKFTRVLETGVFLRISQRWQTHNTNYGALLWLGGSNNLRRGQNCFARSQGCRPRAGWNEEKKSRWNEIYWLCRAHDDVAIFRAASLSIQGRSGHLHP